MKAYIGQMGTYDCFITPEEYPKLKESGLETELMHQGTNESTGKKVTLKASDKNHLGSLDVLNVLPIDAGYDDAHTIQLTIGKANYENLVSLGFMCERWAYGDVFVHVKSEAEMEDY